MRELIEKLYAKYNIGRGASDEEVQTLKRILAEGLWVQTTDSIKQWIAEREIAVLPRLDYLTPYKSLLTDKQIEDVCRYMGCGIAPIRVRAIDHMPESRFGPLFLARRAWDGLLLINLREDNPHFQENVQTILQYCINITEKKPYPAIAPIWLYKNAGEQKYGYISSDSCCCNLNHVFVERENFFEDIILPHLAPSESLFSFADDVRQDYDLAQWSISRLRRKLEKRLSPARIEEQMIKDSMKHYFRLHGANGTHAFVVYIRKLLYDEHMELGWWNLYISKKHIEYRNESYRILRKMCEVVSEQKRSRGTTDCSALKVLSERSTSSDKKVE